jgi:hypothetical protein
MSWNVKGEKAAIAGGGIDLKYAADFLLGRYMFNIM